MTSQDKAAIGELDDGIDITGMFKDYTFYGDPLIPRQEEAYYIDIFDRLAGEGACPSAIRCSCCCIVDSTF